MSFDLAKIARAMQAMSFAGITFLGVYLVLVLPAIMGASSGLILYLAALTVGVQAAQSSVLQVGRQPDIPLAQNPLFMSVLAVGLSALTVVVSVNHPFDAVLATISGSLLGVSLGRSGLIILSGKGGTAYQSFQALRSIGLVVAAVASALAERLSPEAAPVVATLIIAALSFLNPRVGRRRIGYCRPEALTHRAAWAVLLGLLASLFYRNDVNWVRTAVASGPDFFLWHYALIAYGALQGVVGFLVVQVIFSRRRDWNTRIRGWASDLGVQFAITWSLVVLAAFLVIPQLPVVFSVALSAVLAAIVGLMSGLAHVVELNWAPYLAGVVGAALLSASLMLELDARLAIVVENAVIGSLILVFILVFRRRSCSSFK